MRTLFPSNQGPADRVVRIVLGLGLLAWTALNPSFVWGYIGIVPLLTGIVGSCPLYTLMGIRTCPYSPAQKTT
jgi:hypothetical protein